MGKSINDIAEFKKGVWRQNQEKHDKIARKLAPESREALKEVVINSQWENIDDNMQMSSIS